MRGLIRQELELIYLFNVVQAFNYIIGIFIDERERYIKKERKERERKEREEREIERGERRQR